MSVYPAARAWAARGVPTFPCAPNAKHPLTARGLHDASADLTVIEQWERRWPSANLAMPTGAASGLLVVDLDRKGGVDGLETLRSIEIDLGDLTETLAASTPGDGEHRFFRNPAAKIRNSAGRLAGCDAPGFDVRGEGGYVLIAPSCIDGRAYEWRNRMAPAELPTAWIMALTPQREQAAIPVEPWKPSTEHDRSRVESWCVRALQDEARELAATPAGARNDRLWRAAAALGGLVHTGGLDTDNVRRALSWACSTWATRDASKDASTLESGLTFGLAHPRTVEIGDARGV